MGGGVTSGVGTHRNRHIRATGELPRTHGECVEAVGMAIKPLQDNQGSGSAHVCGQSGLAAFLSAVASLATSPPEQDGGVLGTRHVIPSPLSRWRKWEAVGKAGEEWNSRIEVWLEGRT